MTPDIGAYKRHFKRILRKARNGNVKRSYVTADTNVKQEPVKRDEGLDS